MSKEIISSWEKNASEWIKAIESQKIASRKFTNVAILDFLEDTPSNKILDIGCGEGSLTRSISAMGKQAVGIDTTVELLKNAWQKGPEVYYQMSYEDIAAGSSIPEATFDIAIFNFSLYQEKGLPDLF